MLDWLDGLAGPQYTRAILWTLAALVLFILVLLVIRLVRSMTFGTYVAGGRSRKTRLSVMDATAVDSHRRLVLVRRDDVEHLLLIGGPTDVVVERDIHMAAPRRPTLMGEAQPPRPQPGPRPGPGQQKQAAPPRQTASAQPVPASRPGVAATYTPAKAAASVASSAATPDALDPLDDALLNELEISLDDGPANGKSAGTSPSLDEEMTKLLGELSIHKKNG
jgi:hypothetical protein